MLIIYLFNFFIIGASANLTCPSTLIFPQTLSCTYTISSDLGNYTLLVTYGDGSQINNTISDGTYTLNYSYALYGNYTVMATVPFINYTLTQQVSVYPG